MRKAIKTIISVVLVFILWNGCAKEEDPAPPAVSKGTPIDTAEERDPRLSYAQRYVRSGNFSMPFKRISESGDTASDTHFVSVSAFWMDTIPVTIRQYALYDSTYIDSLAANGIDTLSDTSVAGKPAVMVSWKEALLYANWLTCNIEDTLLTGRTPGSDTLDFYSYEKCYFRDASSDSFYCVLSNPGFRLPTVDEWKLAAMGGRNNLYSTSGGEKPVLDSAEIFGRVCGSEKEFKNGLGIYDLGTITAEMAWDWYEPNSLYRLSLDEDYSYDYSGMPDSLIGGDTLKTILGSSSEIVKTAHMSSLPLLFTPSGDTIGFRLVRTVR
ncbi:MAG: formylglycine-generating enzyme family protein [Fibrobacterota bacterium]